MDPRTQHRDQDQRLDFSTWRHQPELCRLQLEKINDRVREELDDFRKLQGGIVTDQEGPLWYRGLAASDGDTLEGHVKKVFKSGRL